MSKSLLGYVRWFVFDSKILNWSQVNKCILVLVFYLFIRALWISWKGFTLLTPEVQQFVNLETLYFHLNIEIVEFFFTLVVIFILSINREKEWAQHFFPYFCAVLLISSMVFDWYSSGLLEAGIVINAMSFIYLLIVLFDRKMLIFTLTYGIAVFIYFLSSGLVNGQVQFKPLFDIDQIGYPNFKNSFWLGSTIYFSAPPFLLGVFILNTILKQWSARESYVTQLSRKDGLTSIYNRRMLNEFLLQLDETEACDYPYAILLIDLDHFKSVNDTYGHLMGDRILVSSANTLKQIIRRSDVLGRYGGEEFLIIIENTHPYEVQRLAERCRSALASHRHAVDPMKSIFVTCSIGVAFSHASQSSLQVVNEADQALYEAKTRGRNQVSIA